VIGLLLASTGRLSGAETQVVRPSPQTGECLGNLTLRATPTNGTVPLTVYFVATEPAESNRTLFDWNFGDGTTLSGLGPASSDPIHVYLSVGDAIVRVTTTDSWSQQSCLVTIYVAAQALSVEISQGQTQGTAPLHVSLSAFIVGGTGTYPSVTWNLSDGKSFVGRAINFTLTQPGQYQIWVNVTDSAGSEAANAATIEVLAGAAEAPPPPYLLWIVVVAIAVLGGVAGGTLLGQRPRERPERRRTPTPTGEGSDLAAVSLMRGADPGALPTPDAPVPPFTLAAVGGATTVAVATGSDLPSGSAPAHRPSTVLSPESIRISKRILQHLRLGQNLDQPGHAPSGLTQQGIQSALNLRQGAVASALARLVAANLVEVRLDHVGGRPRRLKVYRLTPLGERVRRGLRTDGGPEPRADWSRSRNGPR
jgi:DNA-binding MarR family transcriptional regulator